MTDSSSLTHIIQKVQPDEIYNLAAQSHVAVSFEEPEYTANSDALGSLRILEAIRILGLEKKLDFTRRPHQSFMVWCKKLRRKKPRRFIHAALMQSRSFMRTGSP